jgi:glucan phosphorylase
LHHEQKKIEDEAAYEKSLSWMIKTSIDLEDPLLDPAKKVKLRIIYDFVDQRIHEYKRGQMLIADPGRIKLYKAAGVAYQEFK